MIGNSNSLVIQNAAEPYSVFAKNDSSATIARGDRLLLTTGIPALTPQSFTEQTTNFNPICVFDDATFLTTGASFGNMHTLSDGTWSTTANSTFSNTGVSTVYTYHPGGVISFFDTAQFKNDRTGYLITTSGVTTLPYNSLYLGKDANNVHYVFQTNSGQYARLYVYNYETNNFGTQMLTIENSSGYFYFGFLKGSKAILTSGAGNAYIYSVNEGFTYLNKTSISGYYPLFATGADVGDLLFVTDNLQYNYYSLNSSKATAHLFCYKIKSGYSLEMVKLPCLEHFLTTPCYAQYDHRNNMLTVSTTDRIYLYAFDTTYKTLSEVTVFTDTLPTRPNAIKPLRAALLPAKHDLAVLSAYNYLNIYHLGTEESRIVPNNIQYYNADKSFTGYASGETNNDGLYEVLTQEPVVGV